MGFQERGERLQELTSLGCSRRGLEKELKQSATSIRRHMVLAELPEKDRKAIAAGASAKDILAKKAIVDRVRRRQERINEDGITGVLSDRIATTIIEFCRLGKELRKPPILTGDLPAFLDTVKCFLQQFGTSGYKAIKVSKKLEHATSSDGDRLVEHLPALLVSESPTCSCSFCLSAACARRPT
jgi:hypothetical protein